MIEGFALGGEFAGRVGELCAGMQSEAVQWQMTDQAGTVRLVVNASGAVIDGHDTTPFGDEIGWGGARSANAPQQQQGAQQNAEAGAGTTGLYGWNETMRARYASLERDTPTGLEHTDWRKYDGWQGRWTTTDPSHQSMSVGNPQSFNRYAYVQNDPVNFVDPSGLEQCSEAWCSWGGGGNGFWGGGFNLNDRTSIFGSSGQQTITDAEYEFDYRYQQENGPFHFNSAFSNSPFYGYSPNPEPQKQQHNIARAEKEASDCLRGAKQARKQREQNTPYKKITEGFAIKDHPFRTIAGAVLGGAIGYRFGLGTAKGLLGGAGISELANDAVIAADNWNYNAKLSVANINGDIKNFNDCYDKANSKYGVGLQRDSYGYFYTNTYGSYR